MRKHTYHLCLLTAILVLFATNCAAICHWNTALGSLAQCEETCDSLRAYTQFLDRVDEIRSEKQCILDEKINELQLLLENRNED
jgi:hypothetical protein